MSQEPDSQEQMPNAWGVERHRLQALAPLLGDGRWHPLRTAVQRTGLSRAAVLDALGALGAGAEQDRARIRVTGAALNRLGMPPWLPSTERRALIVRGEVAQPSAALAEAVATARSGMPRALRSLDHLAATADTVARRAAFLHARYALAGASMLFLGDHDLTSLAVLELEPSLRATVLDIDQRVLAHLDMTAAERGVPVELLAADLRLTLPPALLARADIAVTDPPYTVAGMRLFVECALRCLRRTPWSRVVTCHGYGERHPSLGARVQAMLASLHVTVEALIPGFNVYDGAEAIGARSDLYVIRPTSRTWSLLDSTRPPDAPSIYTHGPAAEEAAPPPLAEAVTRTVMEAAGAEPERILAGDGWPEHLGRATTLAAVVRAAESLGRHHGAGGAVIANLTPHNGDSLWRLLVGVGRRRALLVVSDRDRQLLGLRRASGADRVLRSAMRLAWRPIDDTGLVVVEVTPAPAPPKGVDAVFRHLVEHPASLVVSAWREGLIGMAASSQPLTRNAARALIAGTRSATVVRSCRLGDIPACRIDQLVDDIEATGAQVH